MQTDSTTRTRFAPLTLAAAAGARLQRYGMLGVLLLLCALFSVLTLRPQHPSGKAAAQQLADQVTQIVRPGCEVVIVARGGAEDERFLIEMQRLLDAQNIVVAGAVAGDPAAIRQVVTRAGEIGGQRLIVASLAVSEPVVHSVLASLPSLAEVPVLTPQPRRWPTFLLRENLLNIANQIAVIAILAIGMTMVIITAGIDLSVGSLIALAAVVAAGVIGLLGGAEASLGGMLAGGAAAVLLCGLLGAFSGLMVTRCTVPPFIATLGMMQVASGIAYIISRGKPIYQLPDGFIALGRQADPLFGLPYAVILMLVLYLAAHLLMSRTVLGRYIYAVGGNAEAARLAGVRVKRVLMFVYTTCAMLAGLGGVVMASQLKSGAPTYGLMYELYVIAAVVVGGTSLSGGEGRIFGTLIGAFIIAVIQNGMNLTNVESYTQKVVLGLVILGAVLLDRLKRR